MNRVKLGLRFTVPKVELPCHRFRRAVIPQQTTAKSIRKRHFRLSRSDNGIRTACSVALLCSHCQPRPISPSERAAAAADWPRARRVCCMGRGYQEQPSRRQQRRQQHCSNAVAGPRIRHSLAHAAAVPPLIVAHQQRCQCGRLAAGRWRRT